MAIARGAGTEIIRTVMADDCDATALNLIVGVQYHIYTVLSIVFHAATWQAAGNFVKCYVQGYDVKVGETDESFFVFQTDMNVTETFIFNDKFSFNGTEPTDFTGPITGDAAGIVKQDAIVDQGSTVSQRLVLITENAADAGHVICTYIDQNNA